MADLLPCPFCGGPDVTWHGPTCTKSTPYDASHRAFPIVRCGCGVQVWGSDWDQSGASAIAKWNDRPTPKTALDSFIDDVEAADIRDAAPIGDGYSVLRSGVVLDPEGRPLQTYLRGAGYECVSIWREGKRAEEYVHRLVATAFCVKRAEEQVHVNHRDGDQLNNKASNLEWCCPAENSIHAARVLMTYKTRAVVGTSLKDGSEIHIPSLSEAAEYGFIRANIHKVINGERKHHAGYVWRDASAPPDDIFKDAARYRWLRDQSNSLETQQRDKGIVNGPSCYHEVEGIWELKSDAELDAAVDAAMSAAMKGEQP